MKNTITVARKLSPRPRLVIGGAPYRQPISTSGVDTFRSAGELRKPS